MYHFSDLPDGVDADIPIFLATGKVDQMLMDFRSSDARHPLNPFPDSPKEIESTDSVESPRHSSLTWWTY